MAMSDRIKELRISAGLTQEELGEKLGLQKSAIAKYENGRVENIKQSTIAKMAEIFNCRPSFLMGWDDSPSASTPDIRALFIEEYGEDLFNLIDQIRRLDDVDRARIMERIEMMLEDDKYKGAESYGEKVI